MSAHPIYATLTDGPSGHPSTRKFTVEILRPADTQGHFVCLIPGTQETLTPHANSLRLTWTQPITESRGNPS